MKFRIISACMIASLFLTFFASSRSENDLPQAELLSYDYSFNTNFGIGYQTNTVLERSDIKNNQWNEEDKWIKLWLRIHILTPRNDEWNHPQQYCQAINVTNVKVSSTSIQDIHYRPKLLPSSNALPLNCSPATMDDSYDDWEEYWKKLFPNWSLSSPYRSTSYWSDSLENGETEWILELLIKDIGQDEEEIHAFVNSLSIQCEIDVNYGKLGTSKICVANGSAQHEVRFDENAVQFRADSFFEEHFGDTNEKTAYLTNSDNVLLCSNDTYLNAFHAAPEQYSLFGISITMLKQMPWAICNVEASITPNDTVIGILTDSADAVYDRDRWKNGFYTLYPIFIVVKTDNMDEQQLKEKLEDLDLFLSFSTEFAGNNNFSRTESIGYPGIRFTVQVNMTELMTLEEALEKIGNISDG